MLCLYSIPSNAGSIAVTGSANLPTYGTTVTVASGGTFAFTCSNSNEILYHNGQPSPSFNIDCHVPPGQNVRTYNYDIVCRGPNNDQEQPSLSSADDRSSGATTPSGASGTSSGVDCQVDATELISNGVFGYQKSKVTTDNAVFSYRLLPEEYSPDLSTYSVPAGETVVFGCANYNSGEERLSYANNPIRPLNIFTWDCPTDNQVVDPYQLPLSCGGHSSSDHQHQPASESRHTSTGASSTSSGVDCQVDATELISNGVFGYQKSKVTTDNAVFSYRLLPEEYSPDLSTYSVPAGETVVFGCANNNSEERLSYANNPIRPLNIFTWDCPTDNQVVDPYQLPLSCGGHSGSDHQHQPASESRQGLLRGSLVLAPSLN